jgi:hypothetical protein
MFFLDSSNNRYFVGRSFEHAGLKYASSAATEAKFLSLGFTKVTVGARPDSRFFTVTGPNNSGAFTTVDRDLAALKESFIEITKQTERSLLATTDYYIIQNVEDSSTYPIPTEVSNHRAAIRAAATARCNEITAITTVSALKTLIDGTGFTQFPDSPTTNYNAY